MTDRCACGLSGHDDKLHATEDPRTYPWADEDQTLDPKRPFHSAKDGKDLTPRRRTGPMLRIRRNGKWER